MEIREVEPDKKIVISKVDFVCDMIDESIPKPLFQNYNHFLILSAPPKAGKSTWIMNCLCKHGEVYNRKFDKVYVVSPSLALFSPTRIIHISMMRSCRVVVPSYFRYSRPMPISFIAVILASRVRRSDLIYLPT